MNKSNNQSHPGRTFSVSFTTGETAALKAAAADEDITLEELLRRASVGRGAEAIVAELEGMVAFQTMLAEIAAVLVAE